MYQREQIGLSGIKASLASGTFTPPKKQNFPNGRLAYSFLPSFHPSEPPPPPTRTSKHQQQSPMSLLNPPTHATTTTTTTTTTTQSCPGSHDPRRKVVVPHLLHRRHHFPNNISLACGVVARAEAQTNKTNIHTSLSLVRF